MAQASYDYSQREGVIAISWDDFHALCKALAAAAARFDPEIILAVGRGGFYPGTLIAHLLQAEIYPVRLSRRVEDVVVFERPRWLLEPPELVMGKRVLVVDEISSSGETLQIVLERARLLGCRQAKAAVLYAHTWGTHVPDLIGIVTDALILNPWDREVYRHGAFRLHPEYAQALVEQGIEMRPEWLPVKPAQGLAKDEID